MKGRCRSGNVAVAPIRTICFHWESLVSTIDIDVLFPQETCDEAFIRPRHRVQRCVRRSLIGPHADGVTGARFCEAHSCQNVCPIRRPRDEQLHGRLVGRCRCIRTEGGMARAPRKSRGRSVLTTADSGSRLSSSSSIAARSKPRSCGLDTHASVADSHHCDMRRCAGSRRSHHYAE